MSLWALFVEEKYAGTSTNSFFNLTFCLLKKFVELWATSSYCFWLAHSVNFNVIIEDDWATQGFNYLILKTSVMLWYKCKEPNFEISWISRNTHLLGGLTVLPFSGWAVFFIFPSWTFWNPYQKLGNKRKRLSTFLNYYP